MIMIDSYDKMPVGIYLDALAIARDFDEDERNLRLLALLSGTTLDAVLSRPFVEVGKDMKRLAFLAKEPAIEKTKKAYKIGPFTLVPTLDFRKITTAQYVDFQELTKEPSEDGRVVEVLSCFLIPEGRPYCEGYDVADVQAVIRKGMPVTDAVSLYAFFFERSLASTHRLLTSSMRLLRKLPESPTKSRLMKEGERLAALRPAGGGSRTWTPFRRLSDLIGTRSGR